MPLVDLPIPHLLGGVSQQPPAGRQPGQVEACDNALLHVVNGLSKRPGTRHLAKLFSGLESVRLVHWINRDSDERYAVLVGERRLRIFDADFGTEFPVLTDGGTTAVGRGNSTSGKPLNYLDPRTTGGIVDQDEDFVIGAGDWLSVTGNSVTSYIAGRGPFKFGRRQSTSAVTADTVAEVGNGAVAASSDIYQDFGVLAGVQILSVYAKKSSSALTDFDLTIADTIFGASVSARFDVSAGGVITVGATSTTGPTVTAEAEEIGQGWYRCSVRALGGSADFPAPGFFPEGGTRRIRIRFQTVGAAPANKRLLLFGCRMHDAARALEPVPAYVFERPDLFRGLTIADSTYLLNTEKVVGATTGTSPSAPVSGFTAGVFVKHATPSFIYKLKLWASDGTTVTYSFTTAAGGTDDTVDIVTALVAAINGGGGLYTASSNIGSTFIISNGSKTLTNIAASDGQGNEQMIAWHFHDGPVTRFTDLPMEFGAGQLTNIAKIVGQDNSPTNDFYARFRSSNILVDGVGVWEETLASGIPFTLDAANLPQVLSRRQDDSTGTKTGTPNAIYFDISPVDWDDRLVGDTTSNPDPGFVGARINDLFLYRGRLGFLSQDKVILSEAAEILNFWRTTVRELPDTDPIELGNATSFDALLHAAPGGDALIISSQRKQFQLIGEPVLTPATAQLVPLRSFELLASTRAVDTGRGTIFARLDGGNSGLLESSLQQDDLLARFEELTAQAPRYIAGEAQELAHSSLTHLTTIRAGEPTHLFLHQAFFDDSEARLQSAVHRWVFQDDTLVRGVAFFEEQLKQVVERAEGWFLEEQPTGTEILEASGLPITHLDRRLDDAQLTKAYAGGPDETTITLPYSVPTGSVMQVVDAATGLLVPIISQTTTTLVVSDDLTATELLVGEQFEMRVSLTRPVVQEQSAKGGLSPRLSHPTDVRHLDLYLADTAFLRCEIDLDLRPTSLEEFSAAGLGTGLLGMGELNTYTGRADFGVYAESSEMALDLVNDTPFPSRVQGGRWQVLSGARAGLS